MKIKHPPSFVDGYEIYDTNLTEKGMLNEFYDKAYDTAPSDYVCIRMATIRTRELGDGWNVSLVDPVKPTYKAEFFVILHRALEHNSTKKVWRLTGYKRSMGDPLQYFNPVIESKTEDLAVSKSPNPSKKENLMNKQELVKSIATKSGLTQDQAAQALSGLTESITEALAKGEDVALIGFGTFSVKDRAGRTGRNPQTGEAIQIAASKVPHFKVGKTLKDAIK